MENEQTLKEAAKEIFKEEYICNGIDIAPAWREGFITGAKWQAERMYSEEEVNEIIAETWLSVEDNEGDETFSQARERILEEFKKTKDGI